jgi:hypothetical protein
MAVILAVIGFTAILAVLAVAALKVAERASDTPGDETSPDE